MRRSLAGLVLLISCVLFAVSIGTWWLQHVAFSPSSDTDIAAAILADDEIRGQVATLISTADAGALEVSTAQLKEFVEQIARLYDGASLMSGFVESAHARLIGELDEAVVITAEEQYTIVRDERAALLPAITLPIPEVGGLAFVNKISRWLVLVAGGAGLLTFVVGLLIRPERGELTFAVAVGLGALSVLLVILGYLVPSALLPALSDTTWMALFPRVAASSRNTTLLSALLAAGAAVALFLGTSGLRQRRQRSTPLSVGRYREQHSWSR